MTLEELQEFLKDENNKKEFVSLVKGLGFETPDDIQGLKNKNQELIDDKKKLREKIENIEKKLDKFNEIDLDEYEELKSKSSGNKGNDELVKLQRDLKKLQEKYDKDIEDKTALESDLNKTLIKNAINTAFDENKIDPVFRNDLQDAFSGKAKIEVEDGERRILFEDKEAGEYFKEWAESDKGKVYLVKPENSGFGKQGFQNQGKGKTMARESFEKLPSDQQMELSKEGIALTD